VEIPWVIISSRKLSWSNGPVEEHINRLKDIKRQMYGRPWFELLKARVLPWDVPQAA
jgi:transposase